jgi:hypothetical protein
MADATGRIVDGPVAMAFPTAKFTFVAAGNTTQMRAYAHDDEPFWILDAIRVGLRVA